MKRFDSFFKVERNMMGLEAEDLQEMDLIEQRLHSSGFIRKSAIPF
jgi:hypothetical protein